MFVTQNKLLVIYIQTNKFKIIDRSPFDSSLRWKTLMQNNWVQKLNRIASSQQSQLSLPIYSSQFLLVFFYFSFVDGVNDVMFDTDMIHLKIAMTRSHWLNDQRTKNRKNIKNENQTIVNMVYTRLQLQQSSVRLATPVTATKGLLNGPGQNNCFLNCAVQVSSMLPFLFLIFFLIFSFYDRQPNRVPCERISINKRTIWQLQVLNLSFFFRLPWNSLRNKQLRFWRKWNYFYGNAFAFSMTWFSINEEISNLGHVAVEWERRSVQGILNRCLWTFFCRLIFDETIWRIANGKENSENHSFWSSFVHSHSFVQLTHNIVSKLWFWSQKESKNKKIISFVFASARWSLYSTARPFFDFRFYFWSKVNGNECKIMGNLNAELQGVDTKAFISYTRMNYTCLMSI